MHLRFLLQHINHLNIRFFPASLQVELHDRSLLAGDLVQRSSSDSSCGQLGTVRMVHVTCHLQALSTKQIIYDVSSSKIDQIVVRDFQLLYKWKI